MGIIHIFIVFFLYLIDICFHLGILIGTVEAWSQSPEPESNTYGSQTNPILLDSDDDKDSVKDSSENVGTSKRKLDSNNEDQSESSSAKRVDNGKDKRDDSNEELRGYFENLLAERIYWIKEYEDANRIYTSTKSTVDKAVNDHAGDRVDEIEEQIR